MNAQPAPIFPGIATLLGYQDDGNGGGFWLYNLVVPIAGHSIGSTVSGTTLERHMTARRMASPCQS